MGGTEAAEERLERLLRSRDEHAPGDWYAASAAFQRLYDEHCARIRSAAREGNHGPHRDPRNLALIERGVARASRVPIEWRGIDTAHDR